MNQLADEKEVDAEGAKEIRYRTCADGSEQPAMFYAPASGTAVPLVMALHTWSANYRQTYHRAIERWCIELGWAYVHPDFRGPNRRPEATGSDLVVRDILSAVAYAREAARIERSEIYLVGTSGGGYTALLMAGRHPEMWAGVSAWAPISDLRAWHAQGRYVGDIQESCGGSPGDSLAVDEEYARRSPLTYLKNARGLALHINAGIHDGHEGSVPVSHSLLAFNEVAEPGDRLSEDEIRFFVEKQAVPPNLASGVPHPSYGDKKPLFRRTSGHATVTIFDGGHELVARAAIDWIQRIHDERKKRSSGADPRGGRCLPLATRARREKHG